MAANDTYSRQENSAGRVVDRTRQPYVGALDANSNPTLVVGDAEVRRYTTALGAARTITLSNTSAYLGARFRIVRTDTAAFTLDVKRHDGTTLKQIGSATAAFVDCQHDGTDWVLTAYGVL